MTRRLGAMSIAMAFVLNCASIANAQVIVTPLASVIVKTTPGFFDLDDAAKDIHPGFGIAVSWLTEGWLGAEGETVFTPSAFSGGDLVTSSRLVTTSASVLVKTPARRSWLVRPYAALGVGIAQIHSDDVAHLFVVDSTQPIATASVGAWTWFRPRVGIRAGLKFVRSLRAIESDSLETWQPSIGLSWRF